MMISIHKNDLFELDGVVSIENPFDINDLKYGDKPIYDLYNYNVIRRDENGKPVFRKYGLVFTNEEKAKEFYNYIKSSIEKCSNEELKSIVDISDNKVFFAIYPTELAIHYKL